LPPLEADLVTDLRDWPYSNYLEWIGERGGTLVDRESVRSHFSTPEAYIEFVADGVPPKWIADAVRRLEG
jgi:hypothetical protein